MELHCPDLWANTFRTLVDKNKCPALKIAMCLLSYKNYCKIIKVLPSDKQKIKFV